MILALLLSALVGVTLGLLGGGGSILMVPLLVYVLALDPKVAIATSLVVVGITAAAATLQHARTGRVRWKTGLTFGGASMAGAYAGGISAQYVPGPVLLLLFGAMMLATAVAMIRRRTPAGGQTADRTAPEPDERPQSTALILLEGFGVGAFTGLVGAGGGFLVVPALVVLGRVPMRQAVATSLLVIALKSGAGLLGYLAHVDIDWTLAALVSGGAIAGSVIGSLLVGKVSPRALRTGFGWFVAAMAVFILAREGGASLPAGVQTLLGDFPRAAAAGVGIVSILLILLGFRKYAARHKPAA